MKPSVALSLHGDAVREAAGRFRSGNPRVFGSALVGADKEGSDLDILVDALPGATLFDLGGLQAELGDLLGVPVDLFTPRRSATEAARDNSGRCSADMIEGRLGKTLDHSVTANLRSAAGLLHSVTKLMSWETQMRKTAFSFGLGLLSCFLFSMIASAAPPQLETKNFTIPSVDPGIELYMRNKHPVGMTAFGPERTVLFIHGATYPAETSFDLPIEGVSMMDLIAQQGYGVFLIDVRGYGGSTRPAEMDQPPADNKPVATSVDAAKDLGAAIDYILKTRDIPKLDLMGWSWGTSIAGSYTSQHNDKIHRLVLYAPAWLFQPSVAPPDSPIAAYRLVGKDLAKARWLKGVPEDKLATLIPSGVFDAWWDATLASDPVGSKLSPPMLRAPNGVVEEFVNNWRAGKPYYDPEKITVPTLLIHAEWDADLPSYQAQAYFKQLTNVPYKRLVELGEGTHTVMLEKNCMQFFREIMGFLSESEPLALH